MASREIFEKFIPYQFGVEAGKSGSTIEVKPETVVRRVRGIVVEELNPAGVLFNKGLGDASKLT